MIRRQRKLSKRGMTMRIVLALLTVLLMTGCSSGVKTSLSWADVGQTAEAQSTMLIDGHEVIVCVSENEASEITEGIYGFMQAMLSPGKGDKPLSREKAQEMVNDFASPSLYRLVNVGTPVRVLKRSSDWVFVEVLDGQYKGFEGYISQHAAPSTETDLKKARNRLIDKRENARKAIKPNSDP